MSVFFHLAILIFHLLNRIHSSFTIRKWIFFLNILEFLSNFLWNFFVSYCGPRLGNIFDAFDGSVETMLSWYGSIKIFLCFCCEGCFFLNLKFKSIMEKKFSRKKRTVLVMVSSNQSISIFNVMRKNKPKPFPESALSYGIFFSYFLSIEIYVYIRSNSTTHCKT